MRVPTLHFLLSVNPIHNDTRRYLGVRQRPDRERCHHLCQTILQSLFKNRRRTAISCWRPGMGLRPRVGFRFSITRSEEHTSELQSLMRISYAVFCLKKKKRLRTTPQANTYSKFSPTHT